MRICISGVTLPHYYNFGNDLLLKKGVEVAKMTKRNGLSSLDFLSFLQEKFGMWAFNERLDSKKK
jgi:hypothetical protein